EWDALQNLAAGRALAGQRLPQLGQHRKEQLEQGPGDQFGDPSPFAGAAVDGTVVEALDETEIVTGEEGAEQVDDERGVEVAYIGVAEHDQVADRLVHRLPHRFARRLPEADLGQDVGDRADLGNGRSGPGRRRVGRTV